MVKLRFSVAKRAALRFAPVALTAFCSHGLALSADCLTLPPKSLIPRMRD